MDSNPLDTWLKAIDYSLANYKANPTDDNQAILIGYIHQFKISHDLRKEVANVKL